MRLIICMLIVVMLVLIGCGDGTIESKPVTAEEILEEDANIKAAALTVNYRKDITSLDVLIEELEWQKENSISLQESELELRIVQLNNLKDSLDKLTARYSQSCETVLTEAACKDFASNAFGVKLSVKAEKPLGVTIVSKQEKSASVGIKQTNGNHKPVELAKVSGKWYVSKVDGLNESGITNSLAGINKTINALMQLPADKLFPLDLYQNDPCAGLFGKDYQGDEAVVSKARDCYKEKYTGLCDQIFDAGFQRECQTW